MKIIDINGTQIRADRIIGFSELQCININNNLSRWYWGFKVYTNVEITIKLEYNTNSDKPIADITRTAIIDKWKQYLRKEANANHRRTLRG